MYYYCPICNQKFSTAREESEHSKTHKANGAQAKPGPAPTEQAPELKKNNSDNEKKEFKPIEFMKRFLNKDVSIRLIDGSTLTGKLTGFSNYDIMLDGKLLLPKHSVLFLQEKE